jgi:hypothetical protein
MRKAVAACAVAMLALVGCGEPAIDVEIPQRPGSQRVADLAGILDAEALEAKLAGAAEDGTDIVALTYETEQAGCGEAYRAAQEFVQKWAANVALVAVAQPGDFGSDEEGRVRCFGLQPGGGVDVPGGLRERIAEDLVPAETADNDWDGAFAVAVDALMDQ